MITTRKVIRDINDIHKNYPVMFKSYGMFLFKLMMFSIEDQEFIVDSLMNAAKYAHTTDVITIISVNKARVNLKDHEQKFRFLLEHSFRCKLCNAIETEEVNLYSGSFRDVCEMCMDKAQEYKMDAVQEVLEDHD